MSTDLTTGRTRRRARAVSAGPETLYEPAPWLIVRSPLLPAQGPGSVAATRPRDGLTDPRVRRALAIGSPDLLDALQRPGVSTRDRARAESKLARYLIRMSTRPTPYGAFAAVSLAEWGDRTTLTVRDDRDRIRTRPDMGWLAGLCLALDADTAVRAESLWTVNACAVERHGRLTLAGTATPQGSIRITSPVREALRLARQPVPYAQLRNHLLEHTTGGPGQVDRLLNQLWERRLLVTDVGPRLTVDNPAVDLRQRLSTRGSCDKSVRALEELLTAMSAFDGAPASEGPSRLRAITDLADALHPASGPVVQTDMARPLGDGGQLNARVGEEYALAAELLLRLSPEPQGSPDLHSYRHRFLAHYGDREAPLLEMLDERGGIGPFGHTHGLDAGIGSERAAVRASTLLDLALTAIRDRTRTVELTDATMTSLQTWDPSSSTAPVSLDLYAFVAATSAQAVDQGNFHLVVGPNLGASSAGRSLGRFGDLLAPDGVAALRHLRAAEHRARPAAGLPVEVVYLPDNHRAANVVVRPVAHDHEIVLDTPSGLPADRVVSLDDIVVGVRRDHFYLRSRKLGVELRPTARHMLNAYGAPPVCAFLDAMSSDGSPRFAPFDWGPAAGFAFLPRVRYGRIVLAPARWLLRPAVGGPDGWTDDASAFARHLAEWRTAWSVPARVYLTMSDNRLLLDLREPDQVDQLRSEARAAGARALMLQEALPDTTDAWLPGSGGRFFSEIVVPLVLRPTPADDAPGPRAAPVRPPDIEQSPTVWDRVRPPGSDWLFVKFYCDRDQQDRLLTGPLRQLCEMIETSGLARRWFFLRYADPDPHLRMRWKGDPEILVRHLLPEITRFTAGLTEDGTVSRLVIDTYERELARYGGAEGTDISEEIFWADSRAVMRLLAHETDVSDSGDLTELIAVTTDDLLAGLNVDVDDRLRWYGRQTETFEDEAGGRRAGKDYRTRQKRLRALLGPPDGPALLGEDVAEILKQRRETLTRAAGKLAALEADGRLTTSHDALWGSYVHLHCNRLLGGRAPSEGHLLRLLQRTRKGIVIAPA